MTSAAADPERRRTGRGPSEAERALLAATRPFTRPSWAVGGWQAASTGALALAALGCLVLDPTGWVRWAVAPLLGLLLVRVFLLQHDAGHHSLLPGRSANLLVGHLASVLLGLPFEPFRTEHHWHHKVQGRLDQRGLDHFDPITDDEARTDPSARWRGRPWHVLLVNLDSLMIRRKFRSAYIMYRRAPGERPANHDAVTRSLWFTAVAHLALHAGLWALGGFWAWAAFVVALGVSLVAGTAVMWVQHNFETVLHVEDPAEWSFVRTALEGTSYLRLPQPLRWFTADGGIHHVHHLNPAIPNYRLEEARRALPELAAVTPLTGRDLVRCFTHAIWHKGQRRMVRWSSLAGSG